MPSLETIAGLVCVATLSIHVVSSLLAGRRCAAPRARSAERFRADRPPVTILRPLRGVDPFDEVTLRSGFTISYPNYELVLCCAEANDPAVALAHTLMADHPDVPARLVVHACDLTANPKLNNLVEGWRRARHEWVVVADCNVLMPPDYVDRLLATWRDDTGLVCAPPVGGLAHGLAAEVECAFLNTYQARWQYTADSIGLGFAQGKSMMFHRPLIDAAGGIVALGREIAEDAAATKIVRAAGLRVRLVDRPFVQPLGARSWEDVWGRQLRWARLRRVTFPLFFVPEILTSSLLAIASGAYGAALFDMPPAVVAGAVALVWFGCEALLARAAGWQLTAWSPVAWVIRDLALPVIWVQAWLGNGFTWRGNDMRVAGAARAERENPIV